MTPREPPPLGCSAAPFQAHALTSTAGDNGKVRSVVIAEFPSRMELNKLWVGLYGHRFFDKSLAARPAWVSQPSEPPHGWTDAEQPIPFITEGPPPASDLDHVR